MRVSHFKSHNEHPVFCSVGHHIYNFFHHTTPVLLYASIPTSEQMVVQEIVSTLKFSFYEAHE